MSDTEIWRFRIATCGLILAHYGRRQPCGAVSSAVNPWGEHTQHASRTVENITHRVSGGVVSHSQITRVRCECNITRPFSYARSRHAGGTTVCGDLI